MPGQFLNPTFASGGVDHQYQAQALIDESILTRANNNWQRRSMAATWDRNGWISGWPSGQFVCNNSDPMSVLGDCAGNGGRSWEPWSNIGSGTQTKKFIKGIAYDSGGAPNAGVIIQGFVTDNDSFVGEVTSNSDGTYILPTNNLASTAHYIVAYKAGSPDTAGTTVNTLLPTNIDGT